MNEVKEGDIYICKLTGKKAKIDRLLSRGRGLSVVYVLFAVGYGLVTSRTNFLKEFKLEKDQAS